MKNNLYKSVSLLLFILFIIFIVHAEDTSDQPMPSVDTFKSLVHELVELKKESAAEEQQWREEKSLLENEYALLEKEKALLQDEIDQAGSEATSFEKERSELTIKKQTYQNALDAVLPVLENAEADLKTWQMIIPTELLGPLSKQFTGLNDTVNHGVPRRLQRILSLYAEIEQLENSVHLVKELITTESGDKREFDVLYLGLVQAYCVSDDNTLAGIGTPLQGGWEWVWMPGIAPSVRKGIKVYRQDGIAEFVSVPFQVEEVKQ